MSVLAPDLIAVLFFLVTGWLALLPVRRGLDAGAYHLAAFPVGLLAAPLAAVFSSLTNRPLDTVSTFAGALLLVAGVAIAAAVAGVPARPVDRPAGPRDLGLTAGAFLLVSAILGVARYTVSNNDSFISYWPLGVALNRDGAITGTLVASRNVLLPAVNAVHASFGSDWAYVIYPLMSASLLGWVAWTLLRGPLAEYSSRVRFTLTGTAVAFLVIEPSYLFHSFFVHSHMASALYLFAALGCLWIAEREGRTPGAGDAYLVLAGVFTAGLALARPDGLAYQFVPVAAAIAVLASSRVRARSVMAYFVPLLLLVSGIFLAIYAELGMWSSSKLSGRTAGAILAVLLLSVIGPWLTQWLSGRTGLKVSGERFLSILTGGAGALMLVVFAARWESAAGALATMRINLFQGEGGYHYLWYAVVAVLVVSLFTGDALRPGSWTRPAFLAIALFFVIAGLVHGTSHEGRIGVGDSLNRVVFHALPLVIWYAAAVAARVMGTTERA